MERIRQALEAIDGTAMQKAATRGSIGSAVQQMRETLLSENTATRQFHAVTQSLRQERLRNLVFGDLMRHSMREHLLAHREREINAVAEQMLRRAGPLQLISESGAEQLLKAARGSGVQELFERFALIRAEDWAAAGATHELKSLVEEAALGVEAAVPKASGQTAAAFLIQLNKAIYEIADPVVRLMLRVLYDPVFLVVMGAVLAPLAQKCIDLVQDQGRSPREVVKEVKPFIAKEAGPLALFAEYRFVGVNTLVVRSGASAGSPRVADLHFGQVIRVLDKRRDFTLVLWSSEDGSVQVRGWVFSRYLKSFN